MAVPTWFPVPGREFAAKPKWEAASAKKKLSPGNTPGFEA
jgi:hypothetical protein